MILAEFIALAVALAMISGGSLRTLANHRLKGESALLVLLPVQVLWASASTRLGISCYLSIVIWLVMMLGIAAILVANTPRHWILALSALGVLANILVISVNQAMPVSITAASEMGVTRVSARAALLEDCLHEELNDRTPLPWLADVIAIPGPPWQRAVVSIGDLLLATGLAAWAYTAARTPRL